MENGRGGLLKCFISQYLKTYIMYFYTSDKWEIIVEDVTTKYMNCFRVDG